MASPNVLSPRVIRPHTRAMPRVTRSPSQPFGLIWKPWQIQPCSMLPVVAGETLTSLMVQCQFWTDPLKAVLKNTPWTFEYFTYYVKFRDLPGWETATDGIGKDLVDMIESGESIAGHQDADGNAWTYCPPGGVDFLLEATKRIVEVYFREDGQAWNAATADNVPLAAIRPPSSKDVMYKLGELPIDVKTEVPPTFGSEWWQALQDMATAKELLSDGTTSTVSMDYEDIVRASGGRAVVRNPDREDLHVPELVAYARHWDYPVNTVEPSTGVPAVAFGHRLRQKMSKAYRFSEFGWLCSYVLARPKVFWKNQEGMFAAMMQDRTNWFMPAEDLQTAQGFLAVGNGTGPLKATMDTANQDYMVDLRDLMRGGEQFLNYAPVATSDAVVTLPEVDFDRDYPTATDVMAVFSDTTNGRIRANGVVDASLRTAPPIVGAGQPTGRQLTEWA